MSFYPQPGNPPIGLSFPLSWYIGGEQPPVTVSFPLSWYIEDSWVSLVREIAWDVKMPQAAPVIRGPLRPEEWSPGDECLLEIELPFPYDSGRLTVFLRPPGRAWHIFSWETPCVPGQTAYAISGLIDSDVGAAFDVLVYWSQVGSPFATHIYLDVAWRRAVRRPALRCI